MAINPRTHWGGFREPVRTAAPARGVSVAFGVRALRLLLAVWWIFAPAILGYLGTFPGRQSIVLGVLLLPILVLGLFVQEMRWFLLAGSLWLIGSALFSGMYFEAERVWIHDLVTGGIGVALGLIPGMFLEDSRIALPSRRRRARSLFAGPVREIVHLRPDDSRVEPPRPIEPPPPPAPHLEERPPPA